jgi:hypothetical protein
VDGAINATASYQDRHGAFHRRRVELFDDQLIVRDEVKGFASKAVLRWRLRPASWRVNGQTITDGNHVLDIGATTAIKRLEIVDGWESRYYMQKTACPILEIELPEPGTVTTTYEWR